MNIELQGRASIWGTQHNMPTPNSIYGESVIDSRVIKMPLYRRRRIKKMLLLW